MDIDTNYGRLYNCRNIAYHKNGHVAECICQNKSLIRLNNLTLLPYYTENERRKLSPSIKFYPDGTLKSVYLEKQVSINTPLGLTAAELITFYPDGGLCRVFPLNGKISAYWSEDREINLLGKMTFPLSVGTFTTRPMCFHFYKNGHLKSLTLQSTERITINTPVGHLKIKCGFSLYKDGQLCSAEPASAQKLLTPIGHLTCCDPNSIGLSADSGSLIFTESGALQQLKTIDIINIIDSGNCRHSFVPDRIPNPLNENALLTLPLTVNFSINTITIEKNTAEKFTFPLHSCQFIINNMQNDPTIKNI
ncbi:hypothetical protein [Pectinatus frisingensis]|uniref:hypothetical protein n=1 Tax=Pectinatus frisingensis TaxID=865 RepID=UPI0018C85B69|nr:hypothetical protein [Pectinatus frisingensis]